MNTNVYKRNVTRPIEPGMQTNGEKSDKDKNKLGVDTIIWTLVR